MKNSHLGLDRSDLTYILRRRIQNIMSRMSLKFNWRAFNPEQFELKYLEVTIPKLPVSFKNYRIVHISDIHYGQWVFAERLEGLVNIINETCPDLVAITGDFVSYLIDASIETMAVQLAKLNPKDATVAVLGNHDHWAGAEKVREILKKSCVRDLSNDVFEVSRSGFKLYIAGLDSITIKKDRFDLVLEKLPFDGPAILLVHEPDFAVTSAATKRFSLQLSGHSHGGQLIIPMLGVLFRGSYFMKYPSGKYRVGDMIQYTNRGVGTNSYWLRINCPPEITVITLV